VRALGTELKITRGGSLWLGAHETALSVQPLVEGTQLFLASDGLG
jgi:mannose-6-phosphate isomerase